MNEPLQTQAETFDAVELQPDRVREQVFVETSAGNFRQQVECAEVGREREVDTALDGLIIEDKREAGRGAAQVRFVWRERSGEA